MRASCCARHLRLVQPDRAWLHLAAIAVAVWRGMRAILESRLAQHAQRVGAGSQRFPLPVAVVASSVSWVGVSFFLPPARKRCER